MALNVTNIKCIRDAIAEAGPAHFIMTRYNCGTAYCIIGWAVHLFAPDREFSWITSRRVAEKFLNLVGDEYGRLTTRVPKDYTTMTPEQRYQWGLRRLDAVIESGRVTDDSTLIRTWELSEETVI